MKKIISIILLLLTININSQIVELRPVKVPAEHTEYFENIHTEYSIKTAQDAKDKGKLYGWWVAKRLNTNEDDFNYLFITVHPSVESLIDNEYWWQNSEEVTGYKPEILYKMADLFEFDKQYIYQVEMQIPDAAEAKYIIINFATPDDLNTVLKESKEIVMPHFQKNLIKSGMVGWGVGTKITPQGSNYSSFATWDSYDSLENMMKHLGGGAAIEGLPLNKLTPIEWSMRPIFRVITGTK